MVVTRLSTENFRNLQDGEIFPCPGVNVIYGGNAQGKTNLLESIWLFTGGHSFRGSRDGELPRFDMEKGVHTQSASLSMDFFAQERNQTAILRIDQGKRSSVINGVQKKNGAALMGKICAVIFSPEHLMLIKEGPARRRNFIDGALCQIKPSYASLLNQYNRSLQQRNALLKDIPKYPELEDTLPVWDIRLAQLGASVMEQRLFYVNKLIPEVTKVYQGISQDKESLSLEYTPSVKADVSSFSLKQASDAFLEELERTRRSDIRTGFTSAGPHRDDFSVLLNGLPAKAFGSQGQQRSVVLSLKLAEAQLLAQLWGEPPLILLDDVMSELDCSRQDYLLNHLQDRQVFITCCSPETVGLMEQGAKFQVENGCVFPQSLS